MSPDPSIAINGLWVTTREIQQHLARYAQRLISNTGDSVYQFRHLGSATGIEFKNRFFVVATNHQRAIVEDGSLGVLYDTGESGITPSRMWANLSSLENESDESNDFVILEYEPDLYRHRHLRSQFLRVDRDCGISPSMSKLLLNIGYPTRLQNIDYYDRQVDMLVSSNIVEYLGETSIQDVHRFRTWSADRYFEDGMSGSPVFCVQRGSAGYYINWLGIVVLGGSGSREGSVINAARIMDVIDRNAFGSSLTG